MSAYYPWIKLLHVTCVTLSVALFALRSWWHWRDSPWRNSPWALHVPHVNDTLLLVAGLTLASILGQYPFTVDWLTAKLVGLLLHIGLGIAALRNWLPGRLAGMAWCGSVAAFGYVVGVALTRDPWLGAGG